MATALAIACFNIIIMYIPYNGYLYLNVHLYVLIFDIFIATIMGPTFADAVLVDVTPHTGAELLGRRHPLPSHADSCSDANRLSFF